MTNYEMVEKLREKASVSYEEAKRALEETNWDLLEAMLLLEKQGVTMQGGQDYSTKAKPKEPVGKDEKETSAFGDAMRQIWCWIRKAVVVGNTNSLVIERHGKEILSFPVTVLVVLLIPFFWAVIIALVAGLFLGLRYSFRGPNLGTNKVNDAMGKAADAAENLKDEFYSRKEKAEDAENTKEEHDA